MGGRGLYFLHLRLVKLRTASPFVVVTGRQMSSLIRRLRMDICRDTQNRAEKMLRTAVLLALSFSPLFNAGKEKESVPRGVTTTFINGLAPTPAIDPTPGVCFMCDARVVLIVIP